MFIISDGVVRDARVKVELIANISHGILQHIDAIVLHQTDSSTAAGTLAGYRTEAKGTGAHFLVDKDGGFFQTVALNRQCWHVEPIKSRCYETHSCSPVETKTYDSYKKTAFSYFIKQVDKDEWKKNYPNRYPGNRDSIGIELVGRALNNTTYELVTKEQQAALNWFLPQLLDSLNLKRTDIYRHPVLSRKNPGEAASAQF